MKIVIAIEGVHTLDGTMAGTLHTKEYKKLIDALVAARAERGLSQVELAKALKRPPSFVAKVELCERRLDVLEFCAWAHALSINPLDHLRRHASLPLVEIPR
ncbi:helix-turn-helix domain-containing protein [Aliiroseovarius crassostreae]|uniref:helix-turn-helix domain-containing protein n=1 Tax=Aliiroseovarius crassostreae TaxID=154981 RepID=UPI0021FAF5D5|nr:helix-turn-helix transcriptional regulator [Aliiroseovarius crassostreae]UWP88435.1 helix-turn-helix domain-containing protein [Aliiroseovarius crassostreae]